MKIIDTRNKADFAKGVIPGSINFQGNNSFATWVRWLLSYTEDFILVADDNTLDDLTRKLRKLGFNNVKNFTGGINEWTAAGKRADYNLKYWWCWRPQIGGRKLSKTMAMA